MSEQTWGELLATSTVIGRPLWTIEDGHRIFRGVISKVESGFDGDIVAFQLHKTEAWNPGEQEWRSLDKVGVRIEIRAPLLNCLPATGKHGQLLFNVPYMGQGVVFPYGTVTPENAEHFVDDFLY